MYKRKKYPMVCKKCGIIFLHPSKFWKKPISFCSEKCRYKAQGIALASAEGTKRKDDFGYIQVKSKGRWVREHRLIMENFLNRRLKKDEIVHHKNCIKTDNRLKNLEILTIGAHLSNHNTEYWKNRKYIKCTIEKCDKKPHARGLCDSHYEKFWRKGELGKFKGYFVNNSV